MDESRRILFVSTRIAGTDGVSLETEKWAHILERMGHSCFYAAGECDRPEAISTIVPEMHFRHPEIDWINEEGFRRERRTEAMGKKIRELTAVIKNGLKQAIERFDIDLLVAENCVTIPMNIPLGIAVVETVMESGIGCIAHHHDFAWERERFLVNALEDYLVAAFPPPISSMQHVTINIPGAREFSRRSGLGSRVIPNIMDFENPPAEPDDYAAGFREAIGVSPDDLLFLQPTRLVHRKGIEHAVELIHLLRDPRAKLVISHASGDEGDRYAARISRYAEALNVPVIFADPWIAPHRGTGETGQPHFTLEDAYAQADFVTYPSTYEGFGNAFLEAIYHRKPILCNRYAIYRTDIEPCGFDVVLMDGYLDDDVVEQVRILLDDPARKKRMVDHNYEAGLRFFSYQRAEVELAALLAKPRMCSQEDAAPGA